MTIIKQVFAALNVQDVQISDLPNPAPQIPITSKLTDLFSVGGFNLINFIFVIIGLVFFANLIISGWSYMMSSGDSKKVAAATSRLINGFVGLVMAIVAFVVVRLVAKVIGLDNPI